MCGKPEGRSEGWALWEVVLLYLSNVANCECVSYTRVAIWTRTTDASGDLRYCRNAARCIFSPNDSLKIRTAAAFDSAYSLAYRTRQLIGLPPISQELAHRSTGANGTRTGMSFDETNRLDRNVFPGSSEATEPLVTTVEQQRITQGANDREACIGYNARGVTCFVRN